jgi:hypothetical protein
VTVATVAGLEIYRGDTFTFTVRFWTDADKTTPLDVSARTFACQLRTTADDSDSVDLDIDDTDASTGIVVVSLASGATTSLTAGQHVLDVQETNGSSITTLFRASRARDR